jgi:hypothetical protein
MLGSIIQTWFGVESRASKGFFLKFLQIAPNNPDAKILLPKYSFHT